ncbi:MAG: thioredoxin family protein [Bacteroidota bacterium]
MKKFIFALLISMVCFTQTKAQDMNKRVFDDKSQTDIIVDNCTREGILSCDFVNDYNAEYPAYKPNATVLDSLKSLLNDISCVIVLGTWCGDSKEQVPRFYKISDLLGNPFIAISLIGVDREKVAPAINVKEKYAIELVPTFIFYRNNTEIGRIIESPKTSIEQDLLNMVKAKK